jgi:hypothetical protein
MRAIVFAALTLAACAAPGRPATGQAPTQSNAAAPLALQIRADMARLDRELRASGVVAAGIGQPADLGDGLLIRPLAVIEDSRCPNNARCVWAGRLRLSANVSGEDLELTLGQPTLTAHGSVLLAVASPGPWTDWPTHELGAKPGYRFGFRRA